MSIEAIYRRRSIRKYQTKEIPREHIDHILKAAQHAPSGKNKQPWKFIVLGGKPKTAFLEIMETGIHREENEKALLPKDHAGLTDAWNTLHSMQQAPIVILVFDEECHTPFAEITAEYRVTEIINTLSIGAAIQNMILEADEIGIGSLWIGNTFYAYPELCSWLHTDMQLVGAIALGYPAESPKARPRKPLTDIAEYRY
jgi:nitroreductase